MGDLIDENMHTQLLSSVLVTWVLSFSGQLVLFSLLHHFLHIYCVSDICM